MDRTIRRTRSAGHRPGQRLSVSRISQTDNHPAIQGSLEYGYEPWGIYLGTWASSVNTMTSDGEIEPVACGANYLSRRITLPLIGVARRKHLDAGLGCHAIFVLISYRSVVSPNAT